MIPSLTLSGLEENIYFILFFICPLIIELIFVMLSSLLGVKATSY